MTPLDRWGSALYGRDLTPSERLVLLEIAYRDGGSGAFASVHKMARSLEVSRRTVQRALRVLVEKGWLTANDRPGHTTVYRFRPIGGRPHVAPRASPCRPNQEVEREGNNGLEDEDMYKGW